MYSKFIVIFKGKNMSRWSSEFNMHPFQKSWKAILQEISSVEVDDVTIASSVEEIARLKKVVAYVDEIINCLDLELTPGNIWSNFQTQSENCLNQIRNFISNRDISHIIKANEHADNLLSYVKPFLIAPAAAIKSLAIASKERNDQLDEYLNKFSEKSFSLIKEIESNGSEAKSILVSSQEANQSIKDYFEILFNGENSVQKKIELVEKGVKEKEALILSAYQEILVAGEDGFSVKQKISNFETAITKKNDELQGLLSDAKQGIGQLSNFYVKIYGEIIDEKTGERSGGLDSLVDQRVESLEILRTDQEKKYQTLFEKIESLLPGATSVGLASAYRTQKETFDDLITKFTRIFYGALAFLVIAGVIMVVDKFSLYPLGIEFVKVGDWDSILKSLLYKAPFSAVLIWLALFASKRRNQYERLQQEYAHKEALASSYESYRKQLESLGEEDKKELQKHLIECAIDAVSFNASSTLDKDHREKMPLEELISQAVSKSIDKLPPVKLQ
jgi:hypothetical protein